MIRANPSVFKSTEGYDKFESKGNKKNENKVNLLLLLQKLNSRTLNNKQIKSTEINQNQSLFNLLDSFFKKNLSEKENILEILEKFLFEFLKAVEKLENIFKSLFLTLKKEKNIEFNLKDILINELWNYLIQDDLIFLLLKFSKTNENYKYITAKQKEYIELIEKGVKNTHNEYKILKKFFNLQNEENINEEHIKFEFISNSELTRKSFIDEIINTSSEKEEKKDSTFDNSSTQENPIFNK